MVSAQMAPLSFHGPAAGHWCGILPALNLLAPSHLVHTSRVAGAAASVAETRKIDKYSAAESAAETRKIAKYSHHFMPVASETMGV